MRKRGNIVNIVFLHILCSLRLFKALFDSKTPNQKQYTRSLSRIHSWFLGMPLYLLTHLLTRTLTLTHQRRMFVP